MVETKKPAWKGRGKKGVPVYARADGNEKLGWRNDRAEYVAMWEGKKATAGAVSHAYPLVNGHGAVAHRDGAATMGGSDARKADGHVGAQAHKGRRYNHNRKTLPHTHPWRRSRPS